MARFFNTTGPCNPEQHYTLPPEARLIRAQLDRYISSELYWVLHAPRQSGKTTFLQFGMWKINAEGKALACYVSVVRYQQFPDAAEAIPMICDAIVSYAKNYLPTSLIHHRNVSFLLSCPILFEEEEDGMTRGRGLTGEERRILREYPDYLFSC